MLDAQHKDADELIRLKEEQLKLLEGFNLYEVGHNSPDYIHLVTEVAKLAFADRDACYGDPEFVDVPIEHLLSEEYSARRRELIDRERASMEFRPGIEGPFPFLKRPGLAGSPNDTTHLDAIAGAVTRPALVTDLAGAIPAQPVLLTFDDGGASALAVSELLTRPACHALRRAALAAPVTRVVDRLPRPLEISSENSTTDRL